VKPHQTGSRVLRLAKAGALSLCPAFSRFCPSSCPPGPPRDGGQFTVGEVVTSQPNLKIRGVALGDRMKLRTTDLPSLR
jgi:hypothetical protein